MDHTEITGRTESSQFTLQTIFWTTTSLAMLLAYARSLGVEAMQQGVAYCALALATGLLLGTVSGNWKDTLFWSALATLLAFVAVAGGRIPSAAVGFGWGAVGALCGAISGARLPKSLWLGILTSAAVGCLAMVTCVRIAGQSLVGLASFDIACAAFVGGIFRPFIQYLQWFEKQSHQPRIVLAAWLTLAVVIGNWLVPIIGGVQR